MKIYTKTGDGGKTSLYSGKRVSKSDLRIHSYGVLDELNSHIGLLRDQVSNLEEFENWRGCDSMKLTLIPLNIPTLTFLSF